MPDWDIVPLYGGYHEAYLLHGHFDEAAARDELLGWDERLALADRPLGSGFDGRGPAGPVLGGRVGPRHVPVHPGGADAPKREMGGLGCPRPITTASG